MALTINKNNNINNGVWEVKLTGEVDISNAHCFRTELESAVAEVRQSVSIDLAELKYIDSTGLGVIIGIYGDLKKDGLCVKVLNPRDNVKKLLVISGLDKLLC